MISDVHRRLRETTREPHERLERRAAVTVRVGTPVGRRAVVEGFHALHAEAEGALAPWLADLPDLDFERRRRLPILDRDLAAVGGRAASGGRALSVAGLGEALGLLYVLEGSTLGGRVIRREVLAAGGDLRGLGFLEPYGEATGERWRAFLAVLAAHGATPARQEAMTEGALAGFALAERCLCGEAADA